MMGRGFRFIDIGANLTSSMYQGVYRGTQPAHPPDLDAVLQRAWAGGLSRIIVTVGSQEDLAAAKPMVASDDRLFMTVGIHPTRCNEFEKNGADPDVLMAKLLAAVKESPGKVVAIGEFGLDYDRLKFCGKQAQLRYFQRQFDLAEATKLPLFLHSRNTGSDFSRIMRENRHRYTAGVVHSFTGTKEELDELLELDLYIGINGCSLKTQENLDVMASIPQNRLMIETDCPWCEVRNTHAGSGHVKTKMPSVKKERFAAGAMVKNRYEPVHIVQVLEVMAAVRKEDPHQLAEAMYANTMRVFWPEEPITQPAAAAAAAAAAATTGPDTSASVPSAASVAGASDPDVIASLLQRVAQLESRVTQLESR